MKIREQELQINEIELKRQDGGPLRIRHVRENDRWRSEIWEDGEWRLLIQPSLEQRVAALEQKMARLEGDRSDG